MTKRVLITGGAGFIGHHTILHIIKNTETLSIYESLMFFIEKNFSSFLCLYCNSNKLENKKVIDVNNVKQLKDKIELKIVSLEFDNIDTYMPMYIRTHIGIKNKGLTIKRE